MKTYFLGWGSLALLNAAIAKADGRGPLKFFLASLFLGPLITLFLASTYQDETGLHLVDIWRGRPSSK